MGRRKAVTLKDLSEELGISVQTISKALRGLPGMSEETRSRIVRAAYLRGYLTVKQVRTMTVQGIAPYPAFRLRFVLLLSRESMNYNRLLTEGLSERFKQYDHQLECFVLDEELNDKDFHRWLEENGILHADGLFIAPRLISSKVEQRLLSLPAAKVLINYPRPLSQVDSIVWDVYEAVCQSVDHLARKGRRRILYVGDIHSQRGYYHRWQAYLDMMEQLGESPMRSTLDELEDNFRRYRPNAVLAAIDEECEEAYRRLIALGVDVPKECGFVGILNEPRAGLPDISRPELLIKETGYLAADRMLWRLAHPHQPFEHTRIIGRFHAGETT